MKYRILTAMFAGALTGALIAIIFSVYIGALIASGSNFASVDFFATNAYITTVLGKTGVVVPAEYHDFVGCVSQLFNAVKPDQMSAASSAIGEYTGIPQIVSFASKNFVYNEEWRTEHKPLQSSMMPKEFLEVRTGVCGDYAFFYAAAVLPCCSTVTVRFIQPNPPYTIGHVFAIYDGTALSYSKYLPATAEMSLWYQMYPGAAVLDVVLTYSNGHAHPAEVHLWSFTNTVTVTYPLVMTKAVITYALQGKGKKVVTKTDYTVYPPVYGTRTVIGDTITIYAGKYTYYISDSMFAAAENSATIIIHYYGYGTTEYYYGLKIWEKSKH